MCTHEYTHRYSHSPSELATLPLGTVLTVELRPATLPLADTTFTENIITIKYYYVNTPDSRHKCLVKMKHTSSCLGGR